MPVQAPAPGPAGPTVAAPQPGDPAQTPPGAGRGGAPPASPGGRGRATFPAQQRPAGDPALIERGRSIYSVTCTSCHGVDLRGGQTGGPNLLRSPVVLSDQVAELLLPIVQGSRADRGMPALPIAPDDVRAVGLYLHSVLATMRGQGAPPPGPPVALTIVVGNAQAGAAYFQAKCSSCHSPTGDLQGIATRVSEPKTLQNLWVSGGRGGGANPRRAVTVSVTQPSGERTEGRLVRYDDFTITLAQADGAIRTFRRDGDIPKVDIRDPMAGHRELLPILTDKDMHDVTAYLVTLK
jgi:cytochrome c oxidase cbb3-type subunit 3